MTAHLLDDPAVSMAGYMTTRSRSKERRVRNIVTQMGIKPKSVSVIGHKASIALPLGTPNSVVLSMASVLSTDGMVDVDDDGHNVILTIQDFTLSV